MGVLPPLQVTVDTKSWCCVLDLRLALARHGPMLALRLAEELAVCLVPRLWYVLDNTEHYRRKPRALLGYSTDPAMADGAELRSLTQWERARMDLGLPALRLYWAGDCLHESFMPKEVDAEVVQRFDRFGRDLEQRLGRAGAGWDATLPLIGGALDSASLAAAMSRYRPLVLTLAGRGEAAPELCRLLDACGLRCQRLADEACNPVRRELLPAFARSGAIELCWAGLELAAVHVVAPGSFLSSPGAGHDLAEDDDLDAHPEEPQDVWEDASAYWYSLP